MAVQVLESIHHSFTFTFFHFIVLYLFAMTLQFTAGTLLSSFIITASATPSVAYARFARLLTWA